ncbi:MAG: type III pantothenate kinase [Phycisphaerae bacterium]
MIARSIRAEADSPAVVIDIGNTSVHIATWSTDEVKTPLSAPTSDQKAVEAAISAHVDALPPRRQGAIVIGSVVPAALNRINIWVKDRTGRDPLVIGKDIPLPIDVAVTDRLAIGIDRVCAAFAAYDKLQSACAIVDFGTAVTVDIVDEEGTLLGGAILPGPGLQLRALHEHTALLPAGVVPVFPQLPYGRNTMEAMQTGVCRGVAGAVRGLVEAYATSLGRWPHVVATGGDLALMAPNCDFLDTHVDYLALRGIGRSYTTFLRDRGA